MNYLVATFRGKNDRYSLFQIAIEITDGIDIEIQFQKEVVLIAASIFSFPCFILGYEIFFPVQNFSHFYVAIINSFVTDLST